MTRKKTPVEPPAPGSGVGVVADQFAQVVELLKALQERQGIMAVDLSGLKEAIVTLADQVAQVVQMCGEQAEQEQAVRDLTQQVYDLQEQLTGILERPTPEEGGGEPTPASSSGPTPASSSGPTPASSSGRPSASPQIDAARARRAGQVPRVGGGAG